MSPLWRLNRLIWREERAALLRGLILSVAVLMAGAALLGLSGWFIAATGAAGLAGLGIAFDVFRPSAGVRFLALGRTAARYGERLLTHDATLRALARLRVRLLGRLSDQPAERLIRLRSPAMLNRVTADVDALDGIAIRLVFPLLAGGITLLAAAAVLAWLVAPAVAGVTVGLLLAGGLAVMVTFGRASVAPAAEAEASRQRLRVKAIEHLRARTALAFAGGLVESRDAVLQSEAQARAAEWRLATLDRRAAALISITASVAAGLALALGGLLALNGAIAPALAAIGVFATLALVEALMPLPRAVAEWGRLRDAAARVAPMLSAPAAAAPQAQPAAAPASRSAPTLCLERLQVAAPGGRRALFAPLDLTLTPGEAVAITGRSGVGKTTLLSAIAGLSAPLSGRVLLMGAPLDAMPEESLRAAVGYLPQRSQLLSGRVRDNLALAAPAATEAEMLALLDALWLTPALARRGGLDLILGEGGAGLSGGESRRLALARVLLRRPLLVLLDEPTEGLDAATAAGVMTAMRRLLPESAFLIATHRPEEAALCDRVLALSLAE
jgi:ATP-binding cassette subfamily C protein CydC